MSEAIAAIGETVSELMRAAAALATSPASLLIAAVAVLAGGSYLIWRNWSAIVRVIRKFGVAVSNEITAIIGEIASFVKGFTPAGFEEDPLPNADAAMDRPRKDRKNGAVPFALDSAWANLSRATVGAPRLSHGFPRRDLALRKAAAAAMIGIPLLAPPATAMVWPQEPRLSTAGTAAMVFNSTPTIVINACQPDDIEHRVLEALRRHREAIFEQWSSELQRRQRTEF